YSPVRLCRAGPPSSFSLLTPLPPLSLPPFPTRRSSDLFLHGRSGLNAFLPRLPSRLLGSLSQFSSAAPAGDAELAEAPEQSAGRSEEHTSELQSPDHLVCRLLLEKKKKKIQKRSTLI